MIQSRAKWIRGMTGGLALLAALACAVMPGGLIPKVAGRCGQALCNCEPEPVVDACNSCHTPASKTAHTTCHLMLVTTSISDADTLGTAFHVVFSGLLAPHDMALARTSEEPVSVRPVQFANELMSISTDIPTPQPKA